MKQMGNLKHGKDFLEVKKKKKKTFKLKYSLDE